MPASSVKRSRLPAHSRPEESFCFLTGRVELRVGREAQADSNWPFSHGVIPSLSIEKASGSRRISPVYPVAQRSCFPSVRSMPPEVFGWPLRYVQTDAARPGLPSALKRVCRSMVIIRANGRHPFVSTISLSFRCPFVTLAELITERGLTTRSLGQRVFGVAWPAPVARWDHGHPLGCLSAWRPAQKSRKQREIITTRAISPSSELTCLTPESSAQAYAYCSSSPSQNRLCSLTSP